VQQRTHDRVADAPPLTSRLESLTSSVNSVIVFDAASRRCIWANEAALNTYGYSHVEINGRLAKSLCAPGHASSVMDRGAAGARGTTTTVHRRKDGSDFDADETVFDVTWDGTAATILLTSDATERVRAERELRDTANAAARVHRLVAFGHWSTDLATGVITWSDEMWVNARIPKPLNSTSPGSGYDVVKRHMHPDDRVRVVAGLNDTVSTGTTNRIEYRSFRGDGTMHWEELIVAREDDETGKPLRLVGTCVDISERKEASEQLLLSARLDPLTGLPNRMLLNERLNAACASAKRRHSDMAILFVDLDGFKEINDTLGHSTGDLLLQSVAARLRSLTRAEDEVARTGGDEFVILLEDPVVVDAAATAQRIIDGFREPLQAGDRTLAMTLSIGVARYPTDGRDGETLLRNADNAMYHAKRSQRGSYRVFENAMHEAAARQFNMEAELREALKNDELVVHYEPVVTIDGDVIGTEALARWPRKRALLTASAFIPVAEQTGLVVPLDTFVLREACRQNAAWVREGRSLTVAVNISALSIAHPDFTVGVQAALEDAGLDPCLLELVLTEIAQGNLTEAAGKVRELRALGVRITIGNFGTGFDALAVLRSLEFDTVKLDKSLVRGLLVNESDKVITSAIIFVVHGLNARITAGGVESEAQRAALAALGCDAAQGAYFGSAMPAGAFSGVIDAELSSPSLDKVA
jgi:diguanylate cyclase (GGDEF)-like protein/PAS domain S-box-containing protein